MIKKHGLRSKILRQYLIFIIMTMLVVIVAVAFELDKTLTSELNNKLQIYNDNAMDTMEHNIWFLIDTTENFSKNHFIINALVDPQGKSTYLPKLIEGLKKRDIYAVSIARFDGNIIFSTLQSPPDYSKSRYMRLSLANGERSFYVSDANNLVIIQPIEYFRTAQGAVIIEVRLEDLFNRIMFQENFCYFLIRDNKKIAERNFSSSLSYVTTKQHTKARHPLLNKLKITLSLGALKSYYNRVIYIAIIKLLIIGAIIFVITFFIAVKMGEGISRPIIDLCTKVDAATDDEVTRCSPIGTNDELEELALSFDRRSEQLLFAKRRLEGINKQLQEEIVERHKAENDLHEAYNNLDRRVRERTYELVLAKEAAEASAKAKGVFLANMSHEIRTPMNSILGFLELSIENNDIPETIKGHLQIAKRSARALLQLINDILDISKIESGKYKLEERPFNLKDMINSIIDTLKVATDSKGLRLVKEISYELRGNYLGDPSRLQQILLNLVGNAIKFTEMGEIKIIIRPYKEKNSIYFAVSDTGIGIPAERLDKIFDAFTQADGSTTRRFGGTGLGTTISKDLIELMGGKIWVESVPGSGSVFHFYINLKTTELASEKIEDYIPIDLNSLGWRPQQAALKILVVEDIEENAILLKTRLISIGHAVTITKNGLEAVKMYRKDTFDLVLMDIQMPVMDGMTATDEIRKIERETKRHTPIIALTASIMKEEMDMYKLKGFDDVIAKPIEFDMLFRTIDNIILPNTRKSNETTRDNEKSGLNFKAGLNVWKDKVIYINALYGFLDKYARAPELLRLYLGDNDMVSAYRLAHSIKGLSANLALNGVADTANELETVLKSGNKEEILKIMPEFESAISKASDSIKGLDRGNRSYAASKKDVDISKLKDILQRLIELLGKFSPNEIDPTFQELQAEIGSQNSSILKKHIDELNFIDAKVETVKLAGHMGITL